MDDCWEIRERLQREPCLKWGFVIYQCTYGDDDAWDRFMHYLNTRVRLTLEEENNDTDHGLFSRIDWNVQEDSSLDNATSEEVREYVLSIYKRIWRTNKIKSVFEMGRGKPGSKFLPGYSAFSGMR